MKRYTTLDVKTDDSLRVKRCTVVFTGQLGSSDINKGDDQEKVTANHITAQECDNLETEIEIAETLETPGDGGQATVDDLKELKLGTTNKTRPIYVSSLPTLEEEKKYFNPLSKYKDVFAWSYNDMPGLDAKVAVHCLSLKKGVSPKKQLNDGFAWS